MERCKIILADRHRTFREGVRRTLECEPDFEIVGEAEEAIALLRLVRFITPGPLMAVLDASLPNLPWMETIRRIKGDRADMMVLVLNIDEDEEYASRALAHGADGYLTKDRVNEEIVQAVRTIREGRTYVSKVSGGSASCMVSSFGNEKC